MNEIDRIYKETFPHQKKIHSRMNGLPLKKADMHVHTSYSRELLPGGSNRAAGYARMANFLVFVFALYGKMFYGKKMKLPNLGAYQMYYQLPFSPKQAFDKAVSKGMDFVPITDHNEVEGAISLIRKYPNLKKRVIVGEEVSCILDKRGYEIHVGAYGIDKRHHDEIQARAKHAERLVKYLKKNGIVFSLNHITSYDLNQVAPLRKEHIEKCIKLFDIFEVRNGLMNQFHNKLSELLAKKYSKGMIGGSDSHSLRAGSTYTAAYVNSKEKFLEQIRNKQSFVFGEHGSMNAFEQEFVEKTSDYTNIFIDGRRAFEKRTAFRDFVFKKLGRYTAGKVSSFIGLQVEKKNLNTLFRFMKEKGLL